MIDEQKTAGSRKKILIPLFVLLAILAATVTGFHFYPPTPGCKLCGWGSGFGQKSVTNVTQEAPKLNFYSNPALLVIEGGGSEIKLAPLPPEKTETPAKATPVCGSGVSTLVITSVVNFTEVDLPFVGVDKEGAQLHETHTDHGREITGTLVTCGNLRKNFWIGFDGKYSLKEEDDLKVSVNNFHNGKDFDLISCDEGEDNPAECQELGVHDDALHTFFVVVWPE